VTEGEGLPWLPKVKDVTGWPELAAATPKRKLPTFPVELFPAVIGGMVSAAAAEIQAPIDIAGMLALPVAASTLAGKVQFTGRTGHNEHAMLWTWSVAASAERKTPVFNLLRQPLVEMEHLHRVTMQQLAEMNEIQAEIVENEIKALKKKTTSANMKDASKQAEFAGLIGQRNELAEGPPAPCAWVTSPTPEGLHTVMAENGGKVAVFTDEGGLVGVMAGRYSTKGSADLDPFLSGYVGGPLKAPRASRDREDVANAYLTIGMSVQPTVLQELAGIGGAEDKGLIGRFLFAMPESLVGTRMYDDYTPVDPAVAKAYAAALTTWSSWPGNADGTMARISLDPEAYRIYAKFSDSIEIRNNPKAAEADLADIPSWGGKIAGTTLRVAGLMHCYGRPQPEALRVPIDEDTISNAIKFTEDYLIPHAQAAFDDMARARARIVETRILSWLAKEKCDEFVARDLYQGLKGKRGSVQRMEDLVPALDQLLIENYLREKPGERADQRIFEVSPRWDRTVPE
jgi:Protein of unknown function (DUF3987)